MLTIEPKEDGREKLNENSSAAKNRWNDLPFEASPRVTPYSLQERLFMFNLPYM